MSLLSSFLDNVSGADDEGLSFAALRAIGKSVVPLHIYNLGEWTVVKFGWNCATYPAAVSVAKKYIWERYEGIAMEVTRNDDVFCREFEIRFVRND